MESDKKNISMSSSNSEKSGKYDSTQADMNSKDTPDDNHIDKNLNPRSYFNLNTIVLKNVQLKSPFPLELNYEEILYRITGDFSNDFFINEKEGVCCKDEEVVKKQSGIFTEIAKQFTKGLLGSGTISMSLPIRIFEPRSMLERYTDWWCYAPIYLKKAGQSKDKLEAFKNVITFALSSIFSSTGQMKPFNPLLGETFEGEFDDKTKIYMEHTSHTPCLSNFLILDSDNFYKFHGYCDINVEGVMKILFNNYLTMAQKGKLNVQLKTTRQTISFHYPKVILGGMIYGKRYVLIDGHMKFEDRENNMKAVIYFNKSHKNLKNRRFHDIYGQIFHCQYSSKDKDKPFYEEKISKSSNFPNDNKLIYSQITGSWLENIIFDNEIYWSMYGGQTSPQIKAVKNCVPSDSRYREDLIWLKRSIMSTEYNKLYEDYAQKWKIALEIQQRHDRSSRENGKKKK
jgi:hypothetical protein